MARMYTPKVPRTEQQKEARAANNKASKACRIQNALNDTAIDTEFNNLCERLYGALKEKVQLSVIEEMWLVRRGLRNSEPND